MHSCHDIKCFCWNGDDDGLRKCIQRNQFVKCVRDSLLKKKLEKKFKNEN